MRNYRFFRYIYLLPLFALLGSCVSSGGYGQGSAADTGVLTREEMEIAAAEMSAGIGEMFRRQGDGKIENVFVALLPTRNDTSEIIDTEILDFALVDGLRAQGVFTVRPEDREAALEEMTFNISGLAEESLSLGEMKSPNYFIKIVISESFYHSGQDRIMEQVIRLELRAVETQLVVWSDSKTFSKKLARRKNDVAW